MALKCCICGNKIGIMEPLSSLSDEYSTEKVCSKCMLKKRELLYASKFHDAVEYFDQYKASKELSPNILNTIDSWIKRGEDMFNMAIEEQKQKDDQQKLFNNHMLTSGYNFEGYKIISYNGIVSGEVVIGTGFLSEFSASISDFLGKTSEVFGNKMTEAKEIATSKMIEFSVSKGGNAIIGVDFDYTTIGNNMIAISANGTSVKIVKQEIAINDI